MKVAQMADETSNEAGQFIQEIEMKREERDNDPFQYSLQKRGLISDQENGAKMQKAAGGSSVVTQEDFKRFMLQCYWQKRVSRNEVIHLNLPQIINIFAQTFDKNSLSLQKSALILLGLQKV